MKRVSKNKRYALGGDALLSAGVAGAGIAGNLITSTIAKNKQRKEENRMKMAMIEQNIANDAIDFDLYNTNGVNVPLYKNGGNIPPIGDNNLKGGKAIPLSSDSVELQGNKHSENNIDNSYGITIQDENNNPLVEVEDEEVMKDNKVFSDVLEYKGKPFSKLAKKIEKEKGEKEDKLSKTKDLKSKNTLERQIQILDSKSDNLFNEQEKLKADNNLVNEEDNVEKMYLGGIADSLSMSPKDAMSKKTPEDLKRERDKKLALGISMVDNVVAGINTASAPSIPKPIYDKPRRMETTVNVNPQLAEVSNAVNAGISDIKNNTSNSNVARANMLATRLKGVSAKNQILGQKENMEISLRNQDTTNRQTIDESNKLLDRGYANTSFQRKKDVQSSVNRNIQNLTSDAKTYIDVNRQDEQSDEDLLTFIMTNDKTDEMLRSARNHPRYKNSPKFREGINAELKRRGLK